MSHATRGGLPLRYEHRPNGNVSPSSYDGSSIGATSSSSTTTPKYSDSGKAVGGNSSSDHQAEVVRQLLEFMSAAEAGDPTATSLFAGLNAHQRLFNAAAECDDLMEGKGQSGMWLEDGYPLSMCVQGDEYYFQLSEDDLRKVFGRYGEVRLIEVTGPGRDVAHVYYEQLADAQNAIQDLNDKVGAFEVMPPPQSVGPAAAAAAATEGPVRKYTCRFDIGIDNDREFQVARRIIGNKGSNMKRIVGLSNAKLRLRGQGSGYLEGAIRQESPDPLHLCISCITRDGYLAAVEETKTLLRRVYAEWRNFQINKGRGDPGMMEIQMKEHFLTAAGERDLDMEYSQPFKSTPMNQHYPTMPHPSQNYYPPSIPHAPVSSRGGPYNYPR
ncbi:hypothetical protein Pmar_PMAR006872 [Perkinsus marinus ATCC 50983]|uniref:RRM domain-containing protein n=1 Tax=Perkinsus marinus (strain ATCC 50983 / TXsc) TaxID=423536 RepID=C5K6Q5_PERM5|nr:hypothetical protein Pmar_PMAR006872 [Perkinsus marinus ATCC 50983]EER19975.1 hypothetical protein Pmar_PMAR006872 [Perkinsus marinus ATCC 50983]|eukprot:XP_002788179.1 hypothetical protein Pmar_PMAR006872 [Perkinsus marinus ATCC 50983]